MSERLPCPITLVSSGYNDPGYERDVVALHFNHSDLKMSEFNLGRGIFVVQFDVYTCAVMVGNKSI